MAGDLPEQINGTLMLPELVCDKRQIAAALWLLKPGA